MANKTKQKQNFLPKVTTPPTLLAILKRVNGGVRNFASSDVAALHCTPANRNFFLSEIHYPSQWRWY